MIGAISSCPASLDAAQRTVIRQMGGFYDLLYWCLKNGKPFDVDAEISRVVDAFAASLRAE